MKKTIRIVSILLVLMILLGTTMTFAAPDPKAYTGDDSANVAGIESLGQNIISIVATVGSIASVIVLVVLGIKYMMGSAEEKAEYKKTLLPYIIGAVLVFAASSIASIVFSFSQGGFFGQ